MSLYKDHELECQATLILPLSIQQLRLELIKAHERVGCKPNDQFYEALNKYTNKVHSRYHWGYIPITFKPNFPYPRIENDSDVREYAISFKSGGCVIVRHERYVMDAKKLKDWYCKTYNMDPNDIVDIRCSIGTLNCEEDC